MGIFDKILGFLKKLLKIIIKILLVIIAIVAICLVLAFVFGFCAVLLSGGTLSAALAGGIQSVAISASGIFSCMTSFGSWAWAGIKSVGGAIASGVSALANIPGVRTAIEAASPLIGKALGAAAAVGIGESVLGMSWQKAALIAGGCFIGYKLLTGKSDSDDNDNVSNLNHESEEVVYG